MSLSEHEKRVLAQMEAQLRGEDAELASTLTGDPHSNDAKVKLVAGPRAWAMAFLMMTAGLISLVVGVSLGYGWVGLLVGILGFCLMVCAVLLPFSSKMVSLLGGPNAALAKNARNQRPKRSDKSTFMRNQEEKWNNRAQD